MTRSNKTDDDAEGAKNRRKRRPSLSSDEFLNKSFHLFSKFGYDGTTIDLITENIGVTKKTIYDRYGDKDALFKAALSQEIGQWIVSQESLQQCETDDFSETLENISFRLLDNLLSPRGLQLLQMTSALSFRLPELGAHNVQHGMKPTIAYLANLFQRRVGDKPGAFPSAEAAGMAFLNLTVGGLANLVAWGILLDDLFIKNYVIASVKLFLNGIVERDDKKTYQMLLDENVKLKVLVADLLLRFQNADRASNINLESLE